MQQPKPVKRSLAFLLVSIALWYIGCNGVTTWWLHLRRRGLGQGSAARPPACSLPPPARSSATFPSVSSPRASAAKDHPLRALFAAMFLTFYFLTTRPFIPSCSSALPSWALRAAINVNSLPMVLEMCRGSDIGKFTGYTTPSPWRRRSSRRCLPAR